MTTERPEDFPDTENPLIVAARYNDAESEEIGLEALVAKLGFDDLQALMHVCEQRALRVILLRRGGEAELRRVHGPDYTRIPLTDFEKHELAYLTTVYLDAICIGVRAAKLMEGDNESSP